MDEIKPDPLLKSKWNFAAVISLFVIVTSNLFSGIAMLTGKMTLQEWTSIMGPLNGVVLGWVSKAITQ